MAKTACRKPKSLGVIVQSMTVDPLSGRFVVQRLVFVVRMLAPVAKSFALCLSKLAVDTFCLAREAKNNSPGLLKDSAGIKRLASLLRKLAGIAERDAAT